MRVVPDPCGPEAELARLARPTGPWIHLLDAAPADGRQLGWLLGQAGVVVRHLRGHCGRSTYGLLDEVGAALQLPGDPVEDWAGLAALLTDMAWLPGAGHVLVVSRAGLLLAAEPPAELAGLVGAVRAVARARAEEGDPIPFHLVLQDDTLGLATLRARLDAAGARYAELSGWDAEEPSAGTAVSTRSTLTGGPVDDVDLAAGTAVSTVEGVKELRRAWESFHGGCGGAVRVYVPMLGGPVDLVAVAGSLAAAVATAGAGCVVVPVPYDPALADRRQAAVTAVATAVWPEPEPVAVTGPVAAEVAETVTAAEPVVATPEPEPAAVPPEPTPVPPEPTPVPPEPAPVTSDPAPVTSDPEPVPPEPAPVTPEPAEVPHDRPGEPFELIAANLQWPFDPGPQEDDAVDTALLAHARTSNRTAGLFRTWVEDPAGGWVRVVLGYVNRTSIADVESERTAVVEILQKSGAARCCVEVLAAADVTEAHRWLEARCRPLWPDPTPPPDAPPRPAGSEPADPPARPIRANRPDSAPGAGSGLAEDAVFRAGPDVGDPTHGPALARLMEWAGPQDGVVALVTAFTTDDRLVVGVALDGGADPDRIRAAAPGPVEPFVPARGLAPVHLRLSRSSTRIWTRRTVRAQPEPAEPTTGGLAVPAAPQVVYQGPPPTRDTDDPRGDTVLDGFTLVGIDRDTAVGKGDPQPDGEDAALVEFARALPGAVALLRGVTEQQLKVYCLAVEDTVDPEDARRRLATAAAGAGLTRAALEAFAPAGAISAFHLDLAVGSTRLWPVRN